MKKVLALVLTLALLLSVVGTAMAASKVGVAMPTQSLQRWNQDGAYMKEKLEEAGYEVDLQYANNEVATQVSQIETMLLNGCEVLVIASIDGSALGTVLATAADMDVPVIAYDRLLTATPDVSYYTTFDNYGVGTIQGTYLKDAFDLDNAAGPFNMEIFCGDPGDNNAGLFFQGAIDVLQPYIDSGVIVIPSGQVEFEQCATADWDSANAQSRMDNLIAAYYTGDTKLDMVLCSNDSTALGVTNSLIAAGFDLDNFPVITGQDCDKANTMNMIAGYQAMSVFKDTRTLAEQTVAMVSDILAGVVPDTNATYNNGVFDVPSYNCTPVFANADNYEELLIDSGYYSKADLGLE
ncbi:MAG TPA: sugar ABC transporter substrate-binding protein [Candidatus Limiplasma sp.]|nr:sugar ABC transporter substrate-binding protein [Candidatus Limiplasma sp.]